MNSTLLGAAAGVIIVLAIWGCQPTLRKPLPRPSAEPYVKTIHQIWFQGDKHLPDRFQPMRAGCSVTNPDWDMRLHDDAALRSFCAEIDQLDPSIRMTELYDSAENMHEKIDMGRLAALHKYGGVSLDMDMHCLNSIDDIVATVPREGLGVCTAPRGPILNLIHHGKNVASVNNAVWVVPRPESPALLKVIKSLAAGARAEYAAHPTTSKYDRVESTWGPKASSIAIAQHPDENIVLLHGLEEPSFSGELSSCNASSALCHVHEGSWLDNKLKASRPVSMFIESYTQRPLVAELVLGAVLGGVLGACVGRAGRKLRRKTQPALPPPASTPPL